MLTPNLNEFRRLSATLGVSLHGPNNDRSSKLMEVTSFLRGPTVVSKGPVDAICDGKVTMMCNASGGEHPKSTKSSCDACSPSTAGFPGILYVKSIEDAIESC